MNEKKSVCLRHTQTCICSIILKFFINDNFDASLFLLIVILTFYHFINQNYIVLSAHTQIYLSTHTLFPFL